jgi:hypothetical protein
LEAFKDEIIVRHSLIDRLLQLMFVIRINTFREFSFDLAEFLKKFNYSYYHNYNISLTREWTNIIASQISNVGNPYSCIDFVEYLGEPFVMLVRFGFDRFFYYLSFTHQFAGTTQEVRQHGQLLFPD